MASSREILTSSGIQRQTISLTDDINIIIACRERDLRRKDIADTREDLEEESRLASNLIIALEKLKLTCNRCLLQHEEVTLRGKKISRDSGVESLNAKINSEHRESEGIQESSPPSENVLSCSILPAGFPSEHQDLMSNIPNLSDEIQDLLRRQGNVSEFRRKPKHDNSI